MILQALNTYYQRLLARGEPGLAPFGYSAEKISYEIVVDAAGHALAINDIRDTSDKKPRPRALIVPMLFAKRTSEVKSNFLWDKTSYVLGVSATSKRTADEHAKFVVLHRDALANTEDTGLKALLAFLDWWTPDRSTAPFVDEAMFDANVVFRFDDDARRYLHERPAAKELLMHLLDKANKSALSGTCLITGKDAQLARLHPSIKGVKGAQSSGADIVSFNAPAYLSYYGALNAVESKDKENNTGANAPISVQAASAYTTMLNHLLRRSTDNHQRLQVGDATVMFWAEAADEDEAEAEAAEEFAASTFFLDDRVTDAQATAQLGSALDQLAAGRPLRNIDPRLNPNTRMYVLGLAPNASRISIRFWYVNTLGALAENVRWHARDLQLLPKPWRRWPSLWRLVLATAPSRNGKSKAEDVPPQLAGELMRAILGGTRYPGSLLANLLMRMRTDGDLSGVRVALCKAVLARKHRLDQSLDEEEIPVSLDRNSTSPGYRLGRLFAVLEEAQRGALGGKVNATIRDRYYGAASATPASVFPVLLRNTQNHLGKLRKDKPGYAVNLEKEIGTIIDGLPEHFPRSLRIEAQGQFAIGYYHQTQARFHKTNAAEQSAPATEEATA